jgi:hypothetical protein
VGPSIAALMSAGLPSQDKGANSANSSWNTAPNTINSEPGYPIRNTRTSVLMTAPADHKRAGINSALPQHHDTRLGAGIRASDELRERHNPPFPAGQGTS